MIKNYDEIIDIVMTFTVKEYLLFGKKNKTIFISVSFFLKKLWALNFPAIKGWGEFIFLSELLELNWPQIAVKPV